MIKTFARTNRQIVLEENCSVSKFGYKIFIVFYWITMDQHLGNMMATNLVNSLRGNLSSIQCDVRMHLTWHVVCIIAMIHDDEGYLMILVKEF